MKYKKIAIIATLGFASSLAVAGSFDGPFVQGGGGFSNMQTEVNAPGWFSSKLSDSSFIGQLAAGYSHSMGSFNLAASAYYVVGDQKAGRFDYSSSGIGSLAFKSKNAWGVSIEPGFNLSESTIAYGKIGYVDAKGMASDNWTSGGLNRSSTYNGSFHGYSYGAGLKHKFSANLYAVAEIQQVNYQSKTWTYSNGYQVSMKPNSLTGIIGIGYKF